MASTVFTVAMDQQQYARFNAAVEAAGASRSGVIQDLVESWLTRQEGGLKVEAMLSNKNKEEN